MGRNKPQRVGGGGGGRPSSTSGTSTVSKDLRSLDQYLEKQHLQRKPTAKDGSCLFRAVSEQVPTVHVRGGRSGSKGLNHKAASGGL